MRHPGPTAQAPFSALLRRTAKTALAVAVTAASVLFLAAALHDSWGELATLALEPRVVAATVLLSAAYGVTFFIQVGAWAYTLRHNSQARVPFGAAAYVYCLCNICKYLPGSVFHFAGRQILGARLGWRHAAIARATLLEIGGTVIGICLTALAIAASPAGRDGLDAALQRWDFAAAHWPLLATGAAATGLVALMVFARLGLFEKLFGVSPRPALTAIGFNTVYFALYAAMAMAFANQLAADLSAADLALAGIAFLIAWLAGFVVPAAPGGIGVRESVLVLLLSGTGAGGAVALALGLGMRCVNTLGDIACLVLAHLLKRLTARQSAAAPLERA